MRPSAALALQLGLLFAGAVGLAAAENKDLATLRRIDARTPSEVQMALALAAGPPVSAAAAVYVLGPKGYAKAREGTNGFTCLVTREILDSMEPECYDAEGTATTLKTRLYVEEQRALGKRDDRIAAEVKRAYKDGRFIAPRKPGIIYMLSDYNYVLDPESGQILHFPGHLMFYAPYATAREVGSGPGAPFLVHPGYPDTLMIVVPVIPSHEPRSPRP